MEVLVSVVNEEQGIQAAAAGARWLDLKNPALGALGCAAEDQQRAFLRGVQSCPDVRRSVALGEFIEYTNTELPQPVPGFHFAKLGTSGLTGAEADGSFLDFDAPPRWLQRWLAWYQALPLGTVGVLVLYADAASCGGIGIEAGLQIAERFQLPYVLVDTFDKTAGGLFTILRRGRRQQIPQWIMQARQQETHLAWAGQLTLADLRQLQRWQAEIAGVRSAVCRLEINGSLDRSGAICPQRLNEVLALQTGCPNPIG